MSKVIPITILIVGGLATIGGYLWWSNNTQAPVTDYQQLSDEVLQQYGKTNDNSQTGEQDVIDVPGISHERMANETVDCGTNPTCLEQKFDRCEPAIAVSNLDLSPIFGSTGLVSFQTEVIGFKNGRCQIEVQYLKNPNPEWLNKKMTCSLDNSRAYEDALSNLFDPSYCSGPLMDVVNKMLEPPAGAVPCDGGGYFMPGEGIDPKGVTCKDF